MKDIQIHTKNSDTRDFVSLHTLQCREAGCDFTTPVLEDEAVIYTLQQEHYSQTDHALYWSYTIQRGQSRIVDPAKGKW